MIDNEVLMAGISRGEPHYVDAIERRGWRVKKAPEMEAVLKALITSRYYAMWVVGFESLGLYEEGGQGGIENMFRTAIDCVVKRIAVTSVRHELAEEIWRSVGSQQQVTECKIYQLPLGGKIPEIATFLTAGK